MRTARIHKAKAAVIEFFSECEPNIFSGEDLAAIFRANHLVWGAAPTMPLTAFIRFLQGHGQLREYKLTFLGRAVTRYAWAKADRFQLARSVRPNGYFSHRSAMYLNDLVSSDDGHVYLNEEQTPKRPAYPARLEQHRIDAAFKRPPRMTRNIAQSDDLHIALLNGMNTGQAGVTEYEHKVHGLIKVTNLERTLIDIAVRPAYSGGVGEVLRAYTAAKSRVAIDDLATLLRQIGYLYPYHQAIGFYLEQSGLDGDPLLAPIRRLPLEFDFYLTHEMGDTNYSKKWRLHYPKELDSMPPSASL